jgi:hypothetical protein
VRVYEELKPAADRYGAEVYRKVRIADVVKAFCILFAALQMAMSGQACLCSASCK